MNYAEEPLKKHYEWKGKIKVITDTPVKTPEDLSLAYAPGVTQPCLETQKNVNKSYKLTRRRNLHVVVTDGMAVLDPGDIGPEAGMPVMKDKYALSKAFGDVDALPFCIESKDVDEIVNTIYLFSGSLGGMNLEDIAAPRCFEIERKLKEKCDISISHDDQHGTAIVVLLGLINALGVVGKDKEKVKAVVNGSGSAGIAVSKLLLSYDFKNLTLCNREGIMTENSKDLNWAQKEMLEVTSLDHKTGTLKDTLVGADTFPGFSDPNMVTEEMVRSMNKDAIIFARANPTPEILSDEAKKGGAEVISVGRSDFLNQTNNVPVSPGLFRGAFDVRAKDINEGMKMATAVAIANLILDDEVNENDTIPKVFDPRVREVVAETVAEVARRVDVVRIRDGSQHLSRQRQANRVR